MATIFELRAGSGRGILAVLFRSGRRVDALRLPDGAIVEEPLPHQRYGAREAPEAFLGITSRGMPATSHHANLGLIVGYLLLTGVYLLPSGEVAAVYGAVAVPVDVDLAITR
jgi:hypothetical protein